MHMLVRHGHIHNYEQGSAWRTDVHNENEARNPFCNLVGPEGLKEPLIGFAMRLDSRAKVGDRIIIILVGHGQAGTANAILNSRAS